MKWIEFAAPARYTQPATTASSPTTPKTIASAIIRLELRAELSDVGALAGPPSGALADSVPAAPFDSLTGVPGESLTGVSGESITGVPGESLTGVLAWPAAASPDG